MPARAAGPDPHLQPALGLATIETAVRILFPDGEPSVVERCGDRPEGRFWSDALGRPERYWTWRQRRTAWQLLSRYADELALAGCDYWSIPEPHVPHDATSSKLIRLDGPAYA